MLSLSSVSGRGWGGDPGKAVLWTRCGCYSHEIPAACYLPMLSMGGVKDNEDPAPLRCSWEWMVSEDRESFSFEDDWSLVRFSCSHGYPTPTRKFKRKKLKRHKIG